MAKRKRRDRKKINSLIPMQKGSERSFVNSWDVPSRIDDGWKVIGNLRDHTSTTKAPVEALHGDAEATAKAKAAK